MKVPFRLILHIMRCSFISWKQLKYDPLQFRYRCTVKEVPQWPNTDLSLAHQWHSSPLPNSPPPANLQPRLQDNRSCHDLSILNHSSINSSLAHLQQFRQPILQRVAPPIQKHARSILTECFPMAEESVATDNTEDATTGPTGTSAKSFRTQTCHLGLQ